MYSEDQIVIVGQGILASGIQNTEDFVKKLKKGKSLAEDLTKKSKKSLPFDFSMFYNPEKKDYFSYTAFGAPYDRGITKVLRKKHNLKKEDYTDSEVLILDVINQICSFSYNASDFKNKSTKSSLFENNEIFLRDKTDLVVASSAESIEVAEWFYKAHYDDLLQKFPEKEKELEKIFEEELEFLKEKSKVKLETLMTAPLLEKLKNYFGFRGESLLFDSACASFLSALYVSMKRLESKKADLVFLVALAESQYLSPPMGAVLFSKIGALSKKMCLPFDHRASGLCFGEAFIGFGLMRLGEAKKRGFEILAVIQNLSGSSDGSFSGITEPSFEGQTLAYKRTYRGVSQQKEERILPKEIDYIETHGTGTVVGDKTELRSLSEFFGNKKIPIGSVKSVLGHTMTASGAAGLLKCLSIFKEREIFPSPYFESFPEDVESKLFLNRKPLFLKKKKPLNIALSSFGFGGCNYHMVLSEYKKEIPLKPRSLEEMKEERGTKEAKEDRQGKDKGEEKIVLCSLLDLSLQEIKKCIAQTQLRLPPRTLMQLDDMQLGALMAVEQTMNRGFSHMEKENVSVISSGHVCLDSAYNFSHKISLLSQKRILLRKMEQGEVGREERKGEKRFSQTENGGFSQKQSQRIITYLDQKIAHYKELTEDTVHGMLTNIVAGRVCNMFHFQGMNFHVDNNFASQVSALECVYFHLKESKGGAFLLSFHEKEYPSRQVRRKGIGCMFLAHREFALKNNLPILYEVSNFSMKKEEKEEEILKDQEKNKEKRYVV